MAESRNRAYHYQIIKSANYQIKFMNNPRLAGRYAKSLLDLAIEQNQVDAVYADMKWIKGVCKSNKDFVALLNSPIIKAGTKETIVNAVIRSKVSKLTDAFIQLLIKKTRESNLPEIVTAFIDQYNQLKNIRRVKITTAAPVTDTIKENILAAVKSTYQQQLEVETAVNEELIGGYLLETEGVLVDASILRDLRDVQKQFMNNDYLHKIR